LASRRFHEAGAETDFKGAVVMDGDAEEIGDKDLEAGVTTDARAGAGSARAGAGSALAAAGAIAPDEDAGRLVAGAVKRAQAGDRDAFAFLYARYADNVFSYVLAIVRDRHEAEDITQHVFTKLISVIGKYQERDVPFVAWLLRVARNIALDHLRRQRSLPVADVTALLSHRVDAGEGRLADLKEALASLPQSQREVLVLRHIAGLSPSEIAVRTGRTEGAIHGLHNRGRKALAKELIGRGRAPITTVAAVG
jgi:RNA polymerase sigma-70 factor, ECF subfamily